MKKYKIGVIFFHKNIKNIYHQRWIDKCISTILNQTINNFTIYEINYGGENYSLFNDIDSHEKKFYSENLKNYAEAMNFIITEAFEDGCDYVFNTNLDDYYRLDRFEKELVHMENGYDLVSSDFCYISENENKEDVVIKHMKIKQYGDIESNLTSNHNIIAHPCVVMNRNFWSENKYDINKTPAEDMNLWQEALKKGYKFYIDDEELLFYRIHQNQVSNKK
jgi:hypothetical protein